MELMELKAMELQSMALTIEVDVDVMGGELTSLGVLSLFSKPHDQSYPTQAYITKLLQSHSLCYGCVLYCHYYGICMLCTNCQHFDFGVLWR